MKKTAFLCLLGGLCISFVAYAYMLKKPSRPAKVYEWRMCVAQRTDHCIQFICGRSTDRNCHDYCLKHADKNCKTWLGERIDRVIPTERSPMFNE